MGRFVESIIHLFTPQTLSERLLRARRSPRDGDRAEGQAYESALRELAFQRRGRH